MSKSDKIIVQNVYSKEEQIKHNKQEDDIQETQGEQEKQIRKQVPASISYVPSVAGLIVAGEVIKDLIKWGSNIIGSIFEKN